MVVHLESGEDVVIVRGTAEDLGRPAQVPEVVAALSAKYTGEGDRQYLPDADPDFDVVYALRPHSAMMWRLADYDSSPAPLEFMTTHKDTPTAAPMRATGVKRVWWSNPVTCVVSPGWA